MKLLFFMTILTIFLQSCDKSDPNPEVSDVIYQDLLQELDLATKSLESEEKNLTKLQKELELVAPQTGQIKFATKKVNETEATINKLRQERQFFEISLDLRKQAVKEKYHRAKKEKKPWPDKAEVEIYRRFMKLQREKLVWEKNKGVKKNVPRGTETKNAPQATTGSH